MYVVVSLIPLSGITYFTNRGWVGLHILSHDDWWKLLEVSAARFFNQFQFSAAFNCFVEGVGGSKEAEVGG